MNTVTRILPVCCFRHLPIPEIIFIAEHGTSLTVAVQVNSYGPSTIGYGFTEDETAVFKPAEPDHM